jgi:uncharacterized protein (TIGR02246 family)
VRRALAGALLAIAAPAAAAPPIDARVQKLADGGDIRTLLHDYGRLLDDRDLAAFAALFAEQGEWVGGLGTARGPSAIEGMMRKAFGDVAPGSNHANFHILSNEIVTVDGDAATAWSRWAFVTAGADGRPAIAMAGHYDDRLVREHGRWRFARRTAITDIGAPPATAAGR